MNERTKKKKRKRIFSCILHAHVERNREAENQNDVNEKQRARLHHIHSCWCEDAVCYTIHIYRYRIFEIHAKHQGHFVWNFRWILILQKALTATIKYQMRKRAATVATKAHSIKTHQYYITIWLYESHTDEVAHTGT